MASVEEFIKAKAVKAFERGDYYRINPYLNIEGKEKWVEMWDKFYDERRLECEKSIYDDDYKYDQPQEVLDIIEANNQSTLRDILIYRYANLVQSDNECGYIGEADNVPDFSVMSDSELLDSYDIMRMRTGMPTG